MQKQKIVLSYILTTFNKLEFIKVTLPLLIAACKADEEIVVVDGGSKDGSSEYLQELFNQKKIHKYLSEKDFGEAHGSNKAILMAEGEIIKLITDDDIYHYPSIDLCRAYMLNHKELDVLGSDGFECNTNLRSHAFVKSNCIEGFKKWKQDGTPFHFCGLSYMFRKNSLAFMGLFNPDFKIIDLEYSIRISSRKTRITFYTGPVFVNIVNPSSNSFKFYKIIDREKKKLIKMYPAIKATIGTRSLKLKTKEFISRTLLQRGTKTIQEIDYVKIVDESIHLLNDANKNLHFEFI